MKKLCIALAAIIVMASCKKESTVTTAAPQPVAEKKLAKFVRVYNGNAPETYEYFYDNQGRLQQSTTDNYSTEYNYLSATKIVVTNKVKSTGNIQNVAECTVGADGRVEKVVYKTDAGFVIYTVNYTYDTEGFLIRSETVNNGGTSSYEYTIANGNCVSRKSFNNGVLKDITVYKHSAQNAIVNYNYTGFVKGQPLFGKTPKNLTEEVKTTNVAGTLTWHTRITSQLDAAGYVTSETTENILQGTQGTTTFTYQ